VVKLIHLTTKDNKVKHKVTQREIRKINAFKYSLLNLLIIFFFLPYSPGKRGQGMRQKIRNKGARKFKYDQYHTLKYEFVPFSIF